MSTNYYAEIGKLTEKDINILKDASPKDTVCLFYGKAATISVEMHEILSSLNLKKKYYKAETEAEKYMYIGMTYGMDMAAENVVLTNISLTPTVKTILNISAAKKEISAATKSTGKKRGRKKASETAELMPDKTPDNNPKIIEDTVYKKGEKAAVETPKETVKATKAPGASKKATESAKQNQKSKEEKSPEAEPDKTDAGWKSSAKNAVKSPYDRESDRDFFARMCKVPENMENRQELMDTIAWIFFKADSINDAVSDVRNEYGEDIGAYIQKNAAILMSCTKGGSIKN